MTLDLYLPLHGVQRKPRRFCLPRESPRVARVQLAAKVADGRRVQPAADDSEASVLATELAAQVQYEASELAAKVRRKAS